MKWYAAASVALVLLVTYAYYTFSKQAELSHVMDDIKLYTAKLETLKREVSEKEDLEQRGHALDKVAETLKSKEGELKGKYGDKLVLEKECEMLADTRRETKAQIESLQSQIETLKSRAEQFVGQTNDLAVAMTRLRGERDAILDDIKNQQADRDKLQGLRRDEEKRYDEQKKRADAEAARADAAKERADAEEKRAAEATRAADAAVARKEDAERDAETAVAAQKKRVAPARKEADAAVDAQEKRRIDAERSASEAEVKASSAQARLKALAEEVSGLEARRNQLPQQQNPENR